MRGKYISRKTQSMIVTIDGIPVYDATISDEETGMFKISLVDDPAVQSNFLAFDKTRKPLMYSISDEEKRIVRGVVMRADFPIYRYDKRMGEYYIIYKADTIRQMAEKYLLESRQNDVNLMHEADSDVDGVQMVQYFIKDSEAGISPAGFEDIADGSLFAEFHIVNDEVWEQVKDGTFKGFSLEGVFDLVPEQDAEQVESIVDSLEGKFNKLFKNFNMSKFKRFKAALAKVLAELANVTTDKGVLAWDGDEDLKAGDLVYVEDAEGNRTPAEDGDYKTEDGKVIKVADGKVSEIVDPEAEVGDDEQELASVATDGGELSYEGELEVGTAVYVTDEEGNQSPAPDGDYKTEDGKTIKVAEGKVSEIVEAPADDNAESKEVAAKRMQKFSESYDERERQIAEAIMASGKVAYDDDNYGFLLDAGDDFGVWDAWGLATDFVDKYFRFPVTWNEDGTAQVGDPVEVKQIFVPMDYLYPWNGESEAETLSRENADLKRQIAELKRKPLTKPAHEEFMSGAVQKTGDKGLDRLASRFSKQ